MARDRECTGAPISTKRIGREKERTKVACREYWLVRMHRWKEVQCHCLISEQIAFLGSTKGTGNGGEVLFFVFSGSKESNYLTKWKNKLMSAVQSRMTRHYIIFFVLTLFRNRHRRNSCVAWEGDIKVIAVAFGFFLWNLVSLTSSLDAFICVSMERGRELASECLWPSVCVFLFL